MDALGALGFKAPAFATIAGDASGRRYARALEGGRTAVVMLSPLAPRAYCTPEMTVTERREQGYDTSVRRNLYRVDAFTCVADYLHGGGLRVPTIAHADADAHFAILEDLGSMDLRFCFDRGYDELTIYRQCLDMLSTLGRMGAPSAPLVSRGLAWPVLDYDLHALTTEASLFLAHFAPHVAGVTASPAMWSEWNEWCEVLFGRLTGGGIVLRDFHSPNIMLCVGPGGYELGAIDFQDMLVGPRLYDLVSLLEDARRELDPRVKRIVLRAAEELYPDVDDFHAEYATISVQRSLKIIGEFMRYAAMGDGRYMPNVPRVKATLERGLAHPALKGFRDWLLGAGLLTPVGL